MEQRNECTDQRYPVNTQAEKEWVEDQLGEVTVSIGRLQSDVMGYQDLVVNVDLPKCGINGQVLLGPDYNEIEANEIANMVGRVLRSHYLRTRLLPLLGDLGEAH